MTKVLDAILGSHWAITDEALEGIVSIASREHEFAGDPAALEKKLGRPLGNTEAATIRDGIAIMSVEGPTFPKANMMTEMSGATSLAMVARDLTAASENPSVRGIILRMDTPGGVITGTSEFAQLVRDVAKQKPVVAYVYGQASSAGYWIASAASKIIAADTGQVGSIGVQSSYRVPAPRAGEKEYTFISSQSPLKNADPGTDDGAKEIRARVDALASVFVSTVAANRGTTVEKVLSEFGKGGVLVAAEALKRGMIDGIGTFEGVLQSMITEISSMDYSKLTVEALAENRPELVKAITDKALAGVNVDAAKAEARAAERARIVAIEALSVPGAEAIIKSAKESDMTPEAAAMAVVKHIQATATASQGGALEKIKAAAKAVDEANPAALESDDPVKAADKGGNPSAAMLDAIVKGVRDNGIQV